MTNLEAANLLDNLIGMVSDNHDSDYDEALSKGRDILKSEPCEDATLKDIFCMGCEYKEQEHSEDAISRKSVIDVIERWLECSGYNEAERHIMRAVQSVLYDSPSVTPQPKTGHWEWVQYDYNPKLGNWHCSECRSIAVKCVDKNEKGGIPLYKYCPNCGAKMVEPQESEGE